MAFKNNQNRRDFLGRLAIMGIGSMGGMSYMMSPGTNNPGPSFSKPPAPVQEGQFPIHVFSKHLQFLDYDAMAEVALEAGFDGVDLTVRPNGHVLPEKAADDLPRAVEAIRKQNLLALMMTTAVMDANDPIQQQVLKTASELGIGFYRTDWLAYDEGLSIPENIDKFKDKMMALGHLNQQLNIIGGYQNHSGSNTLGAPVWDLAGILDEINNPNMGCQYDIRHAKAEGGYSWPLGLKLINPHINSLVIKDFKWEKKDGKWQIINTPLGEGMVDFPEFFALIKAYGITAPISVHYEYKMPEHNQALSESQKRKETIVVMKKDVNTLKGYLKEAGLL